MKKHLHRLSLLLAALFSLFPCFAMKTLSATATSLNAHPVYYGTFQQRKTLAVPKYPAWGIIDDFEIFFNGKPPIPGKVPPRTVAKLSRNEKTLFLQIHATEPLQVRDDNKKDNTNLWSGDLFEIFFGNAGDSPWCAQFVIGAGGGRFSDFLSLNQWKGTARLVPDGYELQLEFPLAAFPQKQGGIGFNLCRTRKAGREFNTWSQVFYGFHEPENFGELLLGDYADIFEQRFALPGTKVTNRASYEKKAMRHSIPAIDFPSIPRLLHPAQDSICVSWESYGPSFGQVDYRKKGEKDFKKVMANVTNLTAEVTCLHKAELKPLSPATEYEYRVVNIHSVDRHQNSSPLYSFHTPPAQAEDFTALLLCDLHANREQLKYLFSLPQIKRPDWFVNMGDMHSGWNGIKTARQAFLDQETEFLQGRIPISIVRGNHECRGNSAILLDTWLGYPNGPSYQMLRWGDIAFVMLDTGDPEGDFFGCQHQFFLEQNKWLQKVTQSPEYTTASLKVILAHIPSGDEKEVETILGDCFTRNQRAKPDVMLCGHTHKYQIRPPRPSVPCPILVCYGLYQFTAKGDNVSIIGYDWDGKVQFTVPLKKHKSPSAQ